MKIVSLTPTDPAKAMNDWQINARIDQLDRIISEMDWRVKHDPGALTPSLLREKIELSKEVIHLRFEQVKRLFDSLEQKDTRPEPAARRWTIHRNQ